MTIADPPKTEIPAGTCISRIQSLAKTSRKSGAKISEFVLTRPREAASATICEFAENVGTSVSTVSRFFARLGYTSYRAFQLDLATCLVGSEPPVSDLFSVGDGNSTVIKRVFQMNRQSLADTESLIDDKMLGKVASLIARARRVLLIGAGGSGLTARSAALRFASLGIPAFAVTDAYEALLYLSSADERDVVVAISHSGRSESIVKLLEFAHEKQANTVGVANYADSPIAKIAEFPLITSFRERRVNAAVSSSAIAQMCLLDAVYFLVAHRQGIWAERLAVEIEKTAEEILRTK